MGFIGRYFISADTDMPTLVLTQCTKLEHGVVILLPRYKDHLAIKTTFAYFHRWSLYQGLTFILLLVLGIEYTMVLEMNLRHCRLALWLTSFMDPEMKRIKPKT